MTPAEAIKVMKQSVEIERRGVEIRARTRCPRGSNALRNAELDVLSGQRSGARYRKATKGKRYYTASAPGEPPARRTGFLRTSWTSFSSGGGSSCSFGIRSNMHYSGYLEHGTSKMAPRPFVDKIIEKAEPEIYRIFGEV